MFGTPVTDCGSCAEGAVRPQFVFLGYETMGLRFAERLKSLTRRGGAEQVDRQDDLFRTMSTLVAASAHSADDDQLEVYDQALLELVDMVELETRRIAARRLAELDRAPGGILVRLASDDEISVAAPILSHSSLLSDDDLIEICAAKSNLHRVAIAERKVLSVVLSDALVQRGSMSVKVCVAKNAGADLSDASYMKLSEQSAADYLLWNALSKRENLPEAISAKLVQIAKTKVRSKLKKDGRHDLAKRLDEATEIAGKKIAREVSQVDTDYERAKVRVQRLAESGRLDEAAIRRFALEDRFADLVVAFSEFVGLRQDCTVEWLSSKDLDPMLVICRAFGFDEATVRAMMKCGARRKSLSEEDRTAALKRLAAMNVDRSRELVQTWRKSFQHRH